MNKFYIRIISLILVAALTVPGLICLSKTDTSAYPGKIPLICIYGEDTPLGIKQPDGTFKPVQANIDVEKVKHAFLDDPNIIIRASFTQDWTEVCDIITELLIDAYKDVVLDENGEATNGSESTFTFSESALKNAFANPNSSIHSYGFRYDWRLDPYENMEKLHTFIEAVLKATGSDKYALYGRCLGSCYEVLYYDMYKDDRITDIILSHSALLGMTPIGEAFSGNLRVNADSVERFVYEYDMGINYKINDSITLTDELIRQILKILVDIYGLDMFCWVTTNAYQQIYDYITPKVMKQSFGTFPGYWAMCEDKYYEDAKKVVFGGEEEKYANFIKKIDNYHYNIMTRATDILNEASSKGIKISSIVKYGEQLMPFVDDGNALSDQLLRVKTASLGAYCCGNDGYFTDSYIKSETEKGNGKYISPDRKINASTCMFPDTTWFIKNVNHKLNPPAIDQLLFAIINDRDSSVDTLEKYPQFLYFDDESGSLVPLDPAVHKAKSDVFNETVANTPARKIKVIFKPLFDFITILVKIFGIKPRAGH